MKLVFLLNVFKFLVFFFFLKSGLLQLTIFLGGLFQSVPSCWWYTEEHSCVPLWMFKSSFLVNYYYLLKNTCLGAPGLSCRWDL